MGNGELTARIQIRAECSGAKPPPDVIEQCAAYLALLAKWNRKINLTAFDLDAPTDSAIDRLIVEPLAAAHHVRSSDALMIDIGSGGGSPAIPMKIAAPWLRVVLVESKTRKAAFLRDAIRRLALREINVDASRAETLRPSASVHLVTVRAVRLDATLSRVIAALLHPAGRVFWFAAVETQPDAIPAGLSMSERFSLGPGASEIRVLTKSS